MTITPPEIAAIAALCLLAGCQHVPERAGVWITVPREMVRCEALDLHNATYDRWQSMTNAQRDDEIRGAS